MTERGRYIVLEGGEHAGKTTQAAMLAAEFGMLDVREPGSTPIGEQIRNLILSAEQPTHPRTDVMLHCAARTELINSIVNPALETGQNVVSDRCWISGAAYQGTQGIPIEDVMAINQIALGERFVPDLLIFLDASPAELNKRAGGPTDKYEAMSSEFHEKVYQNYKAICRDFGAVAINATEPVEQVSSNIRQVVSDFLRS